MSAAGRGRRSMPGFTARTLVMLLAAAIVSGVSVAIVDLVTRPTAPAADEEERAREPQVIDSLGEFAVQLLLVGGIAFVGRKFLKIRL